MISVHRSLFTAHCSLFTVHCSLISAYRSLISAYRSLISAYRSLFTQNVFHRLISAIQNTPTTMITFSRFLKKA